MHRRLRCHLRNAVVVTLLVLLAVPTVSAGVRRWNDLRHGEVRSDGVEYFDFSVTDDITHVTLQLAVENQPDGAKSGSGPELLLNFGSLPTPSTFVQRLRLNDSASASLRVERLRTGRYFTALRGGLVFDSVPALVGSPPKLWFSLNITYTGCDPDSVATDDDPGIDYCNAVQLAPPRHVPNEAASESESTSVSPFIKGVGREYEGCVDGAKPTLWYTFEVQRPQADLTIKLLTTFASGFRVIAFTSYRNVTAIPPSVTTSESAFLRTAVIPRGSGLRSTQLSFDAPLTGRYTVTVSVDTSDKSSCAVNGGAPFTLIVEHVVRNCANDVTVSTSGSEIGPSSYDGAVQTDCYPSKVMLEETRKSETSPLNLADATLTGYQTLSLDNTTTSHGLAVFEGPVDVTYAGVYAEISAQVSFDIASFQILVRIGAYPTQEQFDYQLLSSEAARTILVSASSNSRPAIQELFWEPILYPKVGVWTLLVSVKSASDVITDAGVKMTLKTFACSKDNECKGNGKCSVSTAIHGLAVSTCDCNYGYGGDRCDTASIDPTYRGTQLFFTIASNLAVLPATWLCWRRELYAESLFFLATGVISSFFHACQLNLFCVLGFGDLQHMDFALSFNMLAIVVVHLSGARNHVKAGLHVFYFLSMLLITTQNPNSYIAWATLVSALSLQFAMAIAYYIVLGAARMGLGKGLALRSFLICSRNFDRRYGIVGFVLLGIALTCWFTASSSNYWILHSLWHINVMMSVFCFIALRLNDRYQLLAPDVGVDVLATPSQFRFAVSSVKSIDILEDIEENNYDLRHSWR